MYLVNMCLLSTDIVKKRKREIMILLNTKMFIISMNLLHEELII
jgi:hypothetical protein